MNPLGSMRTVAMCLTPLLSMLLAVVFGAGCAQQGRAVLVRDGKPAATIVVSNTNSKASGFAARELQLHVRKITGATLPIVGDAVPVEGTRILVGDSALTREMGVRPEDFASQEYLIRITDDTVILTGNDGPADSAAAASRQVRPSGSLPVVEGKFAKARAFDGLSAVRRLDSGFRDERGTMDAWVYLPEQAPETTGGTILRLDGLDPWSYHIVDLQAGRAIRYIVYADKKSATVTSGPLASGWHHVAATWDVESKAMTLYVDGAKIGSAEYRKTSIANNPVLEIGGFVRGGVKNGFVGRIDEVRLSDVVRDVPEGGPARAYRPDEHTLALLHFDEADGAPGDAVARPWLDGVPDYYEPQATAYAVHDFLERFCDVRWYAPTDLGMEHPVTDTLVVAGPEVKRSPAFTFRHNPMSSVHRPKDARKLLLSASVDEMKLFMHRHRLGGERMLFNHSFYGWYDRFWKKNPQNPGVWEGEHPEYFAKGYEGQPPQLCYSNPKVIEQIVKDARGWFDTGKAPYRGVVGLRYFALVPMDNSNYCQCEDCKKQIDERFVDAPRFSNGLYSPYIWEFTNRVARELRKTHPEMYVAQLAYSKYAFKPEGFVPEPNVLVGPCLHGKGWYAPAQEQDDRKMIEQWSATGNPISMWLYHCFPKLVADVRGFQYFPGFHMHTLARQMKFFRSRGVVGIYTDGTADQPDLYLFYRMLDDPSLDADRVLSEFYTRYYKEAAAPMRDIFALIERTYMDPANYPEEIAQGRKTAHQSEEIAWDYLGTADRMAAIQDKLDQAQRMVRDQKAKARIEAFVEGLWKPMLAGRKRWVNKKQYGAEVEQLKNQPPPTLKVVKVDEVAGGDPEKVPWEKVASAKVYRTVAGYPTDRNVSVQLAHDGKRLYVRLVDHSDPKALQQATMWHGDHWELFLSADREKPYRMIGVLPDGTFKPLAFGEPKPWNPELTVVSKRPADRWTVLVAVALEELDAKARVKPGGMLYVNFIRGAASGREPLAFSPTFSPSFHSLPRLAEAKVEK